MVRRVLLVLAALAVAMAGQVWFHYRRDISAARTRISSGSRVINTPCGLIEYADVGTGPAVLAIHGAGGGFDQSLDLAKDFLDPGYRVIAPSRFGYLRTPLPADASPVAQGDAHACLLDALNLQKVIVVGGSMGAPSAMQLCLRHPERCSSLVLLFPIAFAPRLAGESPPRPSALTQFLMNTTLRSDFAFWSASKLSRDTVMKTIGATPPSDFTRAAPTEQARVLAVLRNIEPISQREKGLKNDAAVAPSVPRYDLEHITAPTLVIAAEDDLFGTFKGGRYTAEHIPGARFVGFSTGGHLLVGHRNEVKRELTEFLSLRAGTSSPSK
jgi:2-hydroxy-6-oxonona-2,4-dienedioate hydrolase